MDIKHIAAAVVGALLFAGLTLAGQKLGVNLLGAVCNPAAPVAAAVSAK